MTTKQIESKLTEIVDAALCFAEVTAYESVDDLQDEIISEIEASQELTPDEHQYALDRIEAFWHQHGGDDDRDEGSDE
jgi:hypothetical protein